MASSGSILGSYHSNGNYRIRLDWDITSQSIENNTSNVRVRTYLIADWSLSYSATKNGSTTVDGSTQTWSTSTNRSGTGTWLVGERSFTVGHNSDGTKTASISGWFDLNITLGSGAYVGRLSASGSANLDTIPRASSISSFNNFVIGDSISYSISRASSSFTHDVRLRIGTTNIWTTTGVGTGGTITLSDAQKAQIYDAMGSNSSITVNLWVQTKSGSTNIGSAVTQNRTASKASASTISNTPNFTIGSNPTVNISRSRSFVTHSVRARIGSTTIRTQAISGTSATFAFTAANNTTMYGLMPTSTSTTIEFRCETIDAGRVIGVHTRNATVSVGSSIIPGTFSISHSEGNSAVSSSALNGYIRGNSRIAFSISGASGGAGTTSSLSFRIEFDGSAYTGSSTGTYNRTTNTINSSGSLTATVRVTDSRGRSRTQTLSITVQAYNSPSIQTFNTYRADSSGNVLTMGTQIHIVRRATITTITGNTLEYQIRIRPRDGAWSTVRSWTSSGISSGVTASNNYGTYSPAQSFEVEFSVRDQLNQTSSISIIPTGEVSLSIGKTGLGIGKIWESGALDVLGDANIEGNLKLTGGSIDVGPRTVVNANGALVIDDCRAMEGSNGSAVYYPTPTDAPDRAILPLFSYFDDGESWRSGLLIKGWTGSNHTAWRISGPASTSANDNFYLQSGVGNNWRTKVSIWHDGNFNPSTKANASHTHTSSSITDLGDNALTSSATPSTWQNGITSTRSTVTANGYPSQYGALLNFGRGDYVTQFYGQRTGGNRIWFRNSTGSSWGSWSELWHDGSSPMASGYFTMSPTANSPTSVSLSYGKTFTSNPRPFVTANSSVPGSQVLEVSTHSHSTTGCSVAIYRTNTVSTGINWGAVLWD